MKNIYIILMSFLFFSGCDYIGELIEIDSIPHGGSYDNYEWDLPEDFKYFIRNNVYEYIPGNYEKDIFVIKIISAYVYNHIIYVPDNKVWSYYNVWQLPETTWNFKTGDCEDFAILTMFFIKKITGIKGEISRLGEGKNINHAILKLTLSDKILYIDAGEVFFNENIFLPKTIKESIPYGESLWIADTQENEYDLLY